MNNDTYENLICDDCEATYADCLCGTDPREYEEDEFSTPGVDRDYGVGGYFEEDYADDNYSDVEADADTLASAGMGTDEDYGCFDSGDDW